MIDDSQNYPDRRIILVTGASRGIGRSVALRLSGPDTHILALARSVTALESLDDQVRTRGGSASLVPLDLSDSDAIDRLAGALNQRFARLDGIFAAAGIPGPIGPLQTASPSAFQATLHVNLFANWHLVRALDPLLRAANHGRAVFVTSEIARHPPAYQGVHAASKAALDAMVLAYAKETCHTSVRVNLFDPGPTRTVLRAQIMPGEDPQTVPHPDQIAARAVDYLSSEWTGHGQRMRFSLDPTHIHD